jgi:hypothetical protein
MDKRTQKQSREETYLREKNGRETGKKFVFNVGEVEGDTEGEMDGDGDGDGLETDFFSQEEAVARLVYKLSNCSFLRLRSS